MKRRAHAGARAKLASTLPSLCAEIPICPLAEHFHKDTIVPTLIALTKELPASSANPTQNFCRYDDSYRSQIDLQPHVSPLAFIKDKSEPSLSRSTHPLRVYRHTFRRKHLCDSQSCAGERLHGSTGARSPGTCPYTAGKMTTPTRQEPRRARRGNNLPQLALLLLCSSDATPPA